MESSSNDDSGSECDLDVSTKGSSNDDSGSECDREVPTKGSDTENDAQSPKNDGDVSEPDNDFDLLKNDDDVTFKSLGLVDVLCESCSKLGWKTPSRIQQEAIPLALQGKDVIGLAETGSGKTGAFCLPILQALLENPHGLFALVLTPTRELAFQIEEQFKALGTIIGIKTCVIVGGIDMMGQSIILAKKPHIVVATPGRLTDHLRKTKGFSLRTLEYLVLDEADRILNLDFETDLNEILKVIPRKRHTFLFSATMTGKVKKLQRAALSDPVKCAVNSKYHTVDKLLQYYMFIPAKDKESYLVYVVNELAGNAMIIFCTTCINVQRTTLMLRNLGITAVPLHGQMRQEKRLGALNKFKAAKMAVLVATDVASRGLDIPHVDAVLNLDVPTRSKDYIHRVGRTARAGRYGKAITFVTQYDVELYQRIEELIGKKLPAYEIQHEDVKVLQERVAEASRQARTQIKEQIEMIEMKRGKRRRGDLGDLDDTEETAAFGRRAKKGIFNKKFSKKRRK